MGTRETAQSTQRNISTHQQVETPSEMEYLLDSFQNEIITPIDFSGTGEMERQSEAQVALQEDPG